MFRPETLRFSGCWCELQELLQVLFEDEPTHRPSNTENETERERERSLKPSKWKKNWFCSQVRRSVLPWNQPVPRPLSVDLRACLPVTMATTINYQGNWKATPTLPPWPVWRHMKSWAASWWCCWSRRQWPRLPLCHIHEERLWNKKILFHRTSWKYNQKLV